MFLELRLGKGITGTMIKQNREGKEMHNKPVEPSAPHCTRAHH